ncbi:class I SAM-dependent methyltransferase [Desulfonatronum lacustre]|uniref:class I SAM-dependent methyltransferase n=1 Tax=Desulfonatronum lacustre TaxID=66849 RepID=UPI00048BB220|nr:class I SAM-dependent methyltransferase [Desulfonatronum lacustre]
MGHEGRQSQASELLQSWARLLDPNHIPGPVLDLACGDGRNGIYAARHGLEVICCDRSRPALRQARREARARGVRIRLWWTDLEAADRTALPKNTFGAVLVFRYLHRPLIPEIRRAVRPGGYVIYETFTADQPKFGPPRNPDHLLKPEELEEWFRDWEVLHRFEGVLTDPDRAMARIVARKPSA